jgi:hypothetical protein
MEQLLAVMLAHLHLIVLPLAIADYAYPELASTDAKLVRKK